MLIFFYRFIWAEIIQNLEKKGLKKKQFNWKFTI